MSLEGCRPGRDRAEEGDRATGGPRVGLPRTPANAEAWRWARSPCAVFLFGFLVACDGAPQEGGETVTVLLTDRPFLTGLFVGTAVLLVSLFSSWLRNRWLTGPMLCLLLGMALSPLGLLPARDSLESGALEFVARGTIAFSLMAAALHLPRSWLRRRWRSTTVFLLLAMLLMWAAGSAVMRIVLDLDWSMALLLGAVICPTDPVLATTIVTGPLAERDIPGRIRNLLHAESAANDGLALAFVMLPILLLLDAGPSGLRSWIVHVLLWQVLCASALGALAGWLVGLLQRQSLARSLAEYDALLTVSLALAIAVAGGIRAADGDSLLAVFAAGISFRLTVPEDSLLRGEVMIQETVQRLLQLPTFVGLGLLIPWQEWVALGWRGPVLVVAVLLLRRIPALLLLKPVVPALRSWPEALFCGWFGPIGIAAIFYAALSRKLVGSDLLWPVASLLVTASTVVHGLTATPLGGLLRHARSRRRNMG